jgi:alpha-tubulin suppressor-like RCC1 family protein
MQAAVDVVQISAGGTHTCAVHTDAGLECWGDNASLQLGSASGSRNTLGFAVRSVSTGTRFTCAVRGAAVWCWGDNVNYQAGYGGTLGSILPTEMLGVTLADAVAAGDSHACVLMTITGSPSVKCSGRPFSTGTTPVGPILSEVRQLSSGGGHSCAVTLTNGLWCWGANAAGQLGGSVTSNSPQQVAGVVDAVQVAAGGQHTCLLRSDGTLRCWGGNTRGQLGNASADGGAAMVDPGVSGATAVSTGSSHTCAILDGGLWCWGNNDYGQLGVDAGLQSAVPARVGLP